MTGRWILYLGVIFLIIACQGETAVTDFTLEIMEIPEGFPAMQIPGDNAYKVERWELGKKLFYDSRFSLDEKVSCASCHHPQFAFSDTVRFSLGSESAVGTRNATTLANVGYHPYFLREGGVPTLEMQVLVPIEEHLEFNHNIVKLSERLAKDSLYQSMAQKAYNQPLNPYVITRAIANFERSLISGSSAYDLYKSGKKTSEMSDEAIKGMELFFSDKTRCATCHAGFNFTNYSFKNNGLYLNYEDLGRQRLTGKEEDMALFKVPTLRNVSLTAPYMHDGSLKTLEEVISHYDSGGKDHPHKSPLIKPLHLSEIEKHELLEFLKSLEDSYFIQNPKFRY